MKKIATLFVLLTAFVFAGMAQGPFITIDSARTNDGSGVPIDTGVDVTLRGVVYGTNSYKYAGGLIFTINDHHAGIKVYSTRVFGYPTVREGDSVQVTGKLSFYKGEEEISPSRSIVGDTILYLGQGTLDSPTVVTTITEANESQLIELDNVDLTPVTGSTVSGTTGWGIQAGYSNFSAHPNFTSYSIYIDSFVNATLFETPSGFYTGHYNVRGIGAQFKSAAPFTTGYQIVPRGPQDFIALSNTGINTVANTLTASVYPNPASTQVMVTLSSDKAETITAQLYDVTGRIVLSETNSINNGVNTLQFSTANVINGMYILELHTAEKAMMTKIIVAK